MKNKLQCLEGGKICNQGINFFKRYHFISSNNYHDSESTNLFTNSPSPTFTIKNTKQYKILITSIIILLLVFIFTILIILWICMNRRVKANEYQHPDDDLDQINLSNSDDPGITKSNNLNAQSYY